jgi:hypothetical protein
MEKEFIPYEQALALKELGFNFSCFAKYIKFNIGEEFLDIGFSKNEIILELNNLSKFCSAPLYQQAFRFFREDYKLFASIEYSTTAQTDFVITINKKAVNDARDEEYKTYEEAELECLKRLIEIVKTK